MGRSSSIPVWKESKKERSRGSWRGKPPRKIRGVSFGWYIGSAQMTRRGGESGEVLQFQHAVPKRGVKSSASSRGSKSGSERTN